MSDRDLQSLERRTFRSVRDDGLWDVLIAGVIAMFAIAPPLSDVLGDFWSSIVFVPMWLAVYAATEQVRERVVVPRVGLVRFSKDRIQRLHRLGLAMLAVNSFALVLGLTIAIGVQQDRLDIGGAAYPLMFGLMALVVFSAAAYATNIPRYYLYGLMVAIAPLVGEWLWRRDLATHHGYPIVFGISAALIAVAGIARFVSVIRDHPLPPETAMG